VCAPPPRVYLCNRRRDWCNSFCLCCLRSSRRRNFSERIEGCGDACAGCWNLFMVRYPPLTKRRAHWCSNCSGVVVGDFGISLMGWPVQIKSTWLLALSARGENFQLANMQLLGSSLNKWMLSLSTMRRWNLFSRVSTAFASWVIYQSLFLLRDHYL
jgi:hypothetical protein